MQDAAIPCAGEKGWIPAEHRVEYDSYSLGENELLKVLVYSLRCEPDTSTSFRQLSPSTKEIYTPKRSYIVKKVELCNLDFRQYHVTNYISVLNLLHTEHTSWTKYLLPQSAIIENQRICTYVNLDNSCIETFTQKKFSVMYVIADMILQGNVAEWLWRRFQDFLHSTCSKERGVRFGDPCVSGTHTDFNSSNPSVVINFAILALEDVTTVDCTVLIIIVVVLLVVVEPELTIPKGVAVSG